MLFIIYEYVACLLMPLIGETFLLTLSAVCVMLWSGGWNHVAVVARTGLSPQMADAKMDG